MNDVGIDPGKKGGIVMVNWELKRVEFYPLPIAEDGSWDRDQMCQLADLFRFARARVGIEKVQAFPGMSTASLVQTLCGYYLWLGVLAGKGVGVLEVSAADWRREFDLSVDIACKCGIRELRALHRKATGRTRRLTTASLAEVEGVHAQEKEAAYQQRKAKSLAYARANLFHAYKTPRGRDLDGEAEAAIIASYVNRRA